jgi:hypothetical protein
MSKTDTPDKTGAVSFAVSGASPRRTQRVRAFTFDRAPGGQTVELGGTPPAGVEKPQLPTSATLLSIALDSDRRVLVDVSDMGRSGSQAAVRSVGGRRAPALFFIEGEKVYAAAEGSRLRLDRSAAGFQVAAEDCRLELLNATKGGAAGLTRAKGKETVSLSLSLGVPVAPTSRRIKPSKIYERFAKAGLDPKASPKTPPKSATAADAHQLLCIYFAYEVAAHAHAAVVLGSQWWNPWAWLGVAYELYQAWYYRELGRAAHCW